MESTYNRFLSLSTCKIRIITLFLIAVVSLAATGFWSGKRKPFRSYVLVVSLDAFRWDYPDLYNTPNLDKLAAEGVRAERMISSFPTNTFPNHYSIATGLYPEDRKSVV